MLATDIFHKVLSPYSGDKRYQNWVDRPKPHYLTGLGAGQLYYVYWQGQLVEARTIVLCCEMINRAGAGLIYER